MKAGSTSLPSPVYFLSLRLGFCICKMGMLSEILSQTLMTPRRRIHRTPVMFSKRRNLISFWLRFSIDPCSVTDTPIPCRLNCPPASGPISGRQWTKSLLPLNWSPCGTWICKKSPGYSHLSPTSSSLRAGPALPRSLHEAGREPAASSSFPKVLTQIQSWCKHSPLTFLRTPCLWLLPGSHVSACGDIPLP